MKVLLASLNAAKIQGATEAFEKFFKNVELSGINVASNVSEQPLDEEIYLGAKNRVKNLIKYAKNNNLTADYFAAIESGISNIFGKYVIINACVIVDKNGYESWGYSAGFPVPKKYVNKIKKISLGCVMDEIFNENNLRQQKGGINFLTNGVITRSDISRDSFIMALTQFVNEYWKD